MSARIDVMSIRKLGEYNSEFRGPAGKQVALGDWASAIFIPVIDLYMYSTIIMYNPCNTSITPVSQHKGQLKQGTSRFKCECHTRQVDKRVKYNCKLSINGN